MKPQITPFTCNELGFHIPFSKAMNETINFVHNFSSIEMFRESFQFLIIVIHIITFL